MPLLSARVCITLSLPLVRLPRRDGVDGRYRDTREDVPSDSRPYQAVLHGVECHGHRDCTKRRC